MTPRRRAVESAEEQAGREAEQGIRDLEGHLLWAAEVTRVLGAGEEFAGRFGWATADEREDLARVYADQRLEDSRQMIGRVAERARDLQAQYEHRWQQAKNRLVLAVLLAVAAVIFAAAVLFALR